MKRIIVALLALAMMLPSALAMGNVITQSNTQTASGAGVGTITQTGANYGITVGCGNTLTQENVANAKLTAKVNAIAGADAAAGAQADAERINRYSPYPWADWTYYEMDGATSETIGETESLQTSESISGVSIKQDQKNIAIQLGCMNKMKQENDANAVINVLADAEANAKATADAKAGAFAEASCLWDNPLDPFVPLGYATSAEADATAIATAKAAATAQVSDVTIDQIQKNMGVQIGFMNKMKQKNKADAAIDVLVDVDASAIADADAVMDLSLRTYPNYWFPFGYPVPLGCSGSHVDTSATATATAGASASAAIDNIGITQDQKNIGVQLGGFNKMKQKNDATGKIKEVIKKSIPDKDPQSAGYTDSVTIYGTSGQWYWSDSATADSNANAMVSETVANLHKTQTQSNIGVEVGFGNKLKQKNTAIDPMAGSDNEVTQTSKNIAVIVGCMNDAKQINDLYADSDDALYDGKDVINQVADNIAVMVGCCGDVDQANDLDAVQVDDSEVDIYQDDAENIAITVGFPDVDSLPSI